MAKRYLHLANGMTLEGTGFGLRRVEQFGEIVFSTAMTGYCQSLTDPSFAGQILVFTYPIIGNYGVPKACSSVPKLQDNFESDRIWANGVVLSSLSCIGSHYQSTRSFCDWLREEKIPGISGIDTRALTLLLRSSGVVNGCISDSRVPPRDYAPVPKDVVRLVSSSEKIVYTPAVSNGKHIVVVDCGVKHGILRKLLTNGYTITRLPFNGNPLEIPNIDGVVVSNGPGDPKDCSETITIIKKVLDRDIPYLGICLGNQLLALAIGGDTYKLPFGHRGLNQPCQERVNNRVYITSQNHGYAVDIDSLPKGYTEWFRNLNDGTNEGIMHKTKSIRSVQFHPEGCPGPTDTEFIFSLL